MKKKDNKKDDKPEKDYIDKILERRQAEGYDPKKAKKGRSALHGKHEDKVIHFKKNGEEYREEQHLRRGGKKELLKLRKENRDRVVAEVEKQLKSATGGGIALVMNTYDDNGDPKGGNNILAGVDDQIGQIRLAFLLAKASQQMLRIVEGNLPRKEFRRLMEQMSDDDTLQFKDLRDEEDDDD